MPKSNGNLALKELDEMLFSTEEQRQEEKREQVQQFDVLDDLFVETPDSVPLLLCVMLCGLASMNFMTAPSVSLEGKNLWLLHSLPVEPWKIFRAKIGMQLLLTGLPLLLCIICAAVVYPPNPMQLLMLLLFAGSYALLMALFGLFLGIKMPILTWTNEIVPIKQGGRS